MPLLVVYVPRSLGCQSREICRVLDSGSYGGNLDGT